MSLLGDDRPSARIVVVMIVAVIALALLQILQDSLFS